jgi:hypothetical protein
MGGTVILDPGASGPTYRGGYAALSLVNGRSLAAAEALSVMGIMHWRGRVTSFAFSTILATAFLALAPEYFAAAYAGHLSTEDGNEAVKAAMPAADVTSVPTPAQVLSKIFSKLGSAGHDYDMKFGGDIAALLDLTQNNQSVMVRELPPLRNDTTGIVHMFFRLLDDRGFIVVRISNDGLIAFRFDTDFNLVAAAARPNGHVVTGLAGTPAEKMLNAELAEWADLANSMRN